jgi:recombination protein RecA
MYGKGISRTGELLDMAVEKDIVDKSGSWYSYNSDRIGQGRENAKQYIADHPDMEAELRTKVRHAYGIDGAADPDAKDADDQAKDKDSKDTPKADKDAKGTKDTKSAATDAKKPESKDSAKDTPKAKDTKAAADGESIDIFEGTDAKK